jgi:hypothetical protein
MLRILLFGLMFSSFCYADENPVIACFKQLTSDPKFVPIANKLPLGDIREISFQMLANKAVPTKREIGLISDWMDARKSCFTIGLEYAQKNYPPQTIPLATETNNRVTAIIVNLYNKEITYGSANKQIQSIADDYANKLTAVVEQIKSEKAAQQLAEQQAKEQLEAQKKNQQDNDRRISEQRQADAIAQQQRLQAAADAQRRQLAAQNLMNNMNNNKPYQIPVPVPTIRPIITTNCNTFGTQTTCNSN